MLGRKSEEGDTVIDGEDSLLTRVMSKFKTSPPYIIYGGLMGFLMIYLVTMYVLYRTFNSKVIALFVISVIAAIVAQQRWGWMACGIAFFSVLFIGGLFVAYINLKQFALIDATVVPRHNSPIDERWKVDDVKTWLRLNNLDKYENRFGDHGVDGATLMTMSNSRLSSLPYAVNDASDREIIMRGVAKGKAIAHERRKANGDPEPEATGYADMDRMDSHAGRKGGNPDASTPSSSSSAAAAIPSSQSTLSPQPTDNGSTLYRRRFTVSPPVPTPPPMAPSPADEST